MEDPENVLELPVDQRIELLEQMCGRGFEWRALLVESLLAAGRLSEVRPHLTPLLNEAGEDLASALYLVGNVRRFMGEIEDALSDLKRAYELGVGDALLSIAECHLFNYGDCKRADEVLRQVPDPFLSLSHRGVTMSWSGDIVRGLSLLEEAWEYAPSLPAHSRFNVLHRALLLNGLGRYGQSAELLRSVSQLQLDNLDLSLNVLYYSVLAVLLDRGLFPLSYELSPELCLNRAVKIAERSPDPRVQIFALSMRGHYHRTQDDLIRASEIAKKKKVLLLLNPEKIKNFIPKNWGLKSEHY